MIYQTINVNDFTFADVPKENCGIYFLDFEY